MKRHTIRNRLNLGVAYDSKFRSGSTVPATLPANAAWRFGVGAQHQASKTFSWGVEADYAYGGALGVNQQSAAPVLLGGQVNLVREFPHRRLLFGRQLRQGAVTRMTSATDDVRLARPSALPGKPPGDGMVWIPGGTFQMGSDHNYPEEAPVRRVTVDGFWMDRPRHQSPRSARFVDTRHVTFAEIPPNPADYPGATTEAA